LPVILEVVKSAFHLVRELTGSDWWHGGGQFVKATRFHFIDLGKREHLRGMAGGTTVLIMIGLMECNKSRSAPTVGAGQSLRHTRGNPDIPIRGMRHCEPLERRVAPWKCGCVLHKDGPLGIHRMLIDC
jgi:hypothetical protein